MSADLDAIKAMKFTTGINVACGLFVEGTEERALYEEAARHHNARIVLVAKVERLQAALARVEALHQPYKVVDECDHDHTDEDIATGRAYDTGFSYSCDDALLYVACTACCTDSYGDQTEMCADGHRHTKDGPICPTVAALSPALQDDGDDR